MPINIANNQKKDAVVSLISVKQKKQIQYLDDQHLEVKKVRLLKSSLSRNSAKLIKEAGSIDRLGQQLLDADPEIDLELYGRFLKETNRVYFADGKIIFHVNETEIVYNPDGSVKEKKRRNMRTQNINTDVPIQWNNKLIKKELAVKRFVFTSTKQLTHVNGLTFDFLFAMAKKLFEEDSLMIVGGGKTGVEPLIFQRRGKGYRGFLEGRIEGETYMLLLHLSNLELKLPTKNDES